MKKYAKMIMPIVAIIAGILLAVEGSTASELVIRAAGLIWAAEGVIGLMGRKKTDPKSKD